MWFKDEKKILQKGKNKNKTKKEIKKKKKKNSADALLVKANDL